MPLQTWELHLVVDRCKRSGYVGTRVGLCNVHSTTSRRVNFTQVGCYLTGRHRSQFGRSDKTAPHKGKVWAEVYACAQALKKGRPVSFPVLLQGISMGRV